MLNVLSMSRPNSPRSSRLTRTEGRRERERGERGGAGESWSYKTLIVCASTTAKEITAMMAKLLKMSDSEVLFFCCLLIVWRFDFFLFVGVVIPL